MSHLSSASPKGDRRPSYRSLDGFSLHPDLTRHFPERDLAARSDLEAVTRLNTLLRIGGGDCCPGYRREILQEASSPGFDYIGNLILEIKVMAQVVRKEFPTGMKADHFFVQSYPGWGWKQDFTVPASAHGSPAFLKGVRAVEVLFVAIGTAEYRILQFRECSDPFVLSDSTSRGIMEPRSEGLSKELSQRTSEGEPNRSTRFGDVHGLGGWSRHGDQR